MPKRDPTVYEPRYSIDNPAPSGFRPASVCAVSEIQNACAFFKFASPPKLDKNSDPRVAPTDTEFDYVVMEYVGGRDLQPYTTPESLLPLA